MKILLNERFDRSSPDTRLTWHCEPAVWKTEAGKLLLATDPETDFWQKTHYGFSADNGHFLYAETEGDFTMESVVEYDFKNQYDQAGLMVRISPDFWIKTAIEYEPDEANKLGAVVTRDGYSDWSTQDVRDDLKSVFFRILRKGPDFIIQYREKDNQPWVQLRMTHLKDQKTISCGIYACSPKAAGFTASFGYLQITDSVS